ncbi:MAG: sulfite exporter TauE/SafE family protein [Holosporales bacterium]|jgi:uncharacterized membrane protein YfcA|nr:sulfite exporter TauE/SafE family protein [Holosporales bacterium]
MLLLFSQINGLFFSILLIFATGLIGGFASGFLGIGCGVIITPMLMEFGVPPLTAVATQLCHAVGINLTNFLTYKRKHDVDFHLAFYMLVGGIVGSACEWMILEKYSTQHAAFNKFAYVYVVVLVVAGIVMLSQIIYEWRSKSEVQIQKGVLMRRWMLYLPCHRIFARSRSEMSILIPLFIGFLAGVLVASLGGGSSLFMAPIITYLIGRISPVVNGTISIVACVITMVITLIYSKSGYHCDIVCVLLLFAGAAIGSMVGVRLTYTIKRHYTYAMAVVVIFAIAVRQIFKLVQHSFSDGIIRTSFNTAIFGSAEFMKESPLAYTVLCIITVVVIAFMYERFLRKLFNRSKYAGTQQRDA